MTMLEPRSPEAREASTHHLAGMVIERPYMEHRWGTRRRCRARVAVTTGSGLGGEGRLRNISITGAFLETALPVPVYTQLSVAVLRDDGLRHTLDFPAVVVRHDADGIGIEWCDPDLGSICGKLGCDVECPFTT